MARRLVAVLVFAVVYAALARLGLALDAVGGFATLVWPPTGLSLAVLWIFGRQLWPGVLLGAFVANSTAGAPLLIAAAIAVGNTLEGVVGVLALQRARFHPALERLRDVLALVGLAGLAVPLVSASIGVVSLWLGALVPAAELGVTLRSWWIGDALGVLVVAPVLLTWMHREQALPNSGPRARVRWFEAGALAAVASALALFLFGRLDRLWAPLRQPFVLFPIVVWAAVRLRQRAVTTVVLFLSAAAIAGTALGQGPFARDRLSEGLATLQVFTAILALGGLVLGALVAERARAEHALAEAVRVRDEFVSVASHELRTPLSVLSLDLGRLVKMGEAPVQDQPGMLADRMRRALRQTERLNFLVENLLGASRIAHGRFQVEAEACDLAVLAGEVVSVFSTDPSRADRQITLEAQGPVLGRWDSRLVEQAITNLVSNAVKYGEGKPITVTVSATGDEAILAVRDQGIGIAPEDVSRIFDRFERAVAPRHFGGLGLGLYITRQIAEAHGGRVLVTSAVGSGSTFTLELPLSPSTSPPQSPSPSSPLPA